MRINNFHCCLSPFESERSDCRAKRVAGSRRREQDDVVLRRRRIRFEEGQKNSMHVSRSRGAVVPSTRKTRVCSLQEGGNGLTPGGGLRDMRTDPIHCRILQGASVPNWSLIHADAKVLIFPSLDPSRENKCIDVSFRSKLLGVVCQLRSLKGFSQFLETSP